MADDPEVIRISRPYHKYGHAVAIDFDIAVMSGTKTAGRQLRVTERYLMGWGSDKTTPEEGQNLMILVNGMWDGSKTDLFALIDKMNVLGFDLATGTRQRTDHEMFDLDTPAPAEYGK